MNELVIDLKEPILQLFTALQNSDRFREDFAVSIEKCVQSAAERILYFEKTNNNHMWKLLDGNGYRLLNYALWNHVLRCQSKDGSFVCSEKNTVVVKIRGTLAYFSFEKI